MHTFRHLLLGVASYPLAHHILGFPETALSRHSTHCASSAGDVTSKFGQCFERVELLGEHRVLTSRFLCRQCSALLNKTRRCTIMLTITGSFTGCSPLCYDSWWMSIFYPGLTNPKRSGKGCFPSTPLPTYVPLQSTTVWFCPKHNTVNRPVAGSPYRTDDSIPDSGGRLV
jgi:hypothetical protein